MSKYLLTEHFKKTDIAYMARVNRESLTQEKYNLVKNFNQKNLSIFNKTIFISDNNNYVRNLYYLYGENLNYYYADHLWLISSTEIKTKNILTKKKLPKYYVLDLDEDNTINFKSSDKQVTGFGWNDLDGVNGKNLEGYQSTILFRVKGKKCLKY